MIRSEAIVDYEKYHKASVILFVDNSNAGTAYRILSEHGTVIERLAALFSARVMLADQSRITPDAIVENDLADAWVVLVAEGPSRALSTKSNPHRLNVDNNADWECCAFKEVVRQVKESTRIVEDVTGCYGKFPLRRPVSRGRPLELRSN